MTGYGHALYFLKNGDYSLRRVATVLIRLNLLSCILPYMMRTDYLFYYFAPLVSFWFLIIYCTLKIGHRNNTSADFVMKKILLSAMITTAFTKIPGILEFIAFMLKYTCSISWNVTEWRFRMFLDMYIVYVGMIVAVVLHRTSQLGAGSVGPKATFDSILEWTIKHNKIFKIAMALLSLGLLPSFWLLTRRSPNNKITTGGCLSSPSYPFSRSSRCETPTVSFEIITPGSSHGSAVALSKRTSFSTTFG